MQENTKFGFAFASSEEYPGKLIFEFYKDDCLIGSNYNARSGRFYDSFQFFCKSTGVYHMILSFKDGKKGHAVGVLTHVLTSDSNTPNK